MWNLQSRLANSHIVEEQYVQIQGSRPVREARCAIPPKLQLQFQQPIQQVARLQDGLQLDYRIHKQWLLGKTHRLGSVKRRSANNPPQRFHSQGHRSQGCLRRPRPTGQIRPHPDVRRVHEFKTIAERAVLDSGEPPQCRDNEESPADSLSGCGLRHRPA